MIAALAHINMLVPPNTLHLAEAFYGDTLGLASRAVPKLQQDCLRWFDIGASGQQVHIAFGPAGEGLSSRHPCFRLESGEALVELRRRIWEHFEAGGGAAPMEADRPGDDDSGAKGEEYPSRFFARDYAGNRLEFSL
ncbi:hypothetical protein LTR08_003210 [Meristemomyces frigidus]|nr:hypothetical protein LTR08_003210 [Meristemomyces frigidus]